MYDFFFKDSKNGHKRIPAANGIVLFCALLAATSFSHEHLIRGIILEVAILVVGRIIVNVLTKRAKRRKK